MNEYYQWILNGQITTSELSDETCRQILRRILHRHRPALQQLEGQRAADEAQIPKLKVTLKKSQVSLPKK